MKNPSKVVIIDDDDVFQIMISMMVKRAGLDADPLCFGNGQAAVDYLLEHLPNTEHTLLLLDLNMPIMDGWEFLANSKNHQALGKYPVVIVSSSTDKRDREQAASYTQVIDFLTKPVSIEDLNQLALKLTTA